MDRASHQELRCKLHFVCPEGRLWPELASPGFLRIEESRLSELAVDILDAWVLRTYYEFRRIGIPVTISSRPCADAVNVMSVRHFGRREYNPKCFYLVPRGDAHFPRLANFVINQNSLRAETRTSANLPHWPQPGLVGRSPNRQRRISRLVYKGRESNLDAVFRSGAFRKALESEGVDFQLDGLDKSSGAQNWRDYSSADAVLAVRNLTRYDASKKPASKLINSWLAGVVPFLGPEPAFAELASSQFDFIEVRTPEEVIAAVREINGSPGLFSQYLDRGALRSSEFTVEKTLRRWVDLINGPVSDAFHSWRAENPVIRSLLVAGRLVSEGISRDLDKRLIRHGPRILGN